MSRRLHLQTAYVPMRLNLYMYLHVVLDSGVGTSDQIITASAFVWNMCYKESNLKQSDNIMIKFYTVRP